MALLTERYANKIHGTISCVTARHPAPGALARPDRPCDLGDSRLPLSAATKRPAATRRYAVTARTPAPPTSP